MSLRVSYSGTAEEKLKSKDLVVIEFLSLTPADFPDFVNKYGGKKSFDELLVKLLWMLHNE